MENKVKEYLNKYNKGNDIITFDVSSATVALAAKALNCEEAKIAKTLSFKLKDKCIVIVTAGDVFIDNPKYRKYFGEKARMLKGEEVEPIIGHPIGGVCPFAINPDVEIYLDESLKRFEYIYPACGSSNNAIKLTPLELAEITNNPKWIDVCKQKVA